MGCCNGSQTVQTYTQALADIQEAAYAAVDAAADLVFEESSDDEDAKHKKHPDCLYLVFLDKKGEEHGVGFYRQGLGMTLSEWSDKLQVAGFHKTDVNEAVSPAEELGVEIGWSLIRIGATDVSEMLPTDAVMMLREKELCLMQHRSVKPWVQVVSEDKSRARVDRHIEEIQAKHTVIKDAFITQDPRGVDHGDVSVVAFHYPGFKTRVDRMCQASFLSNFHDSSSDVFVVHDAFHGTEGKSFSNVECATLAMEVWSAAEELRYSGPEDARRVVTSIKATGVEETDLQSDLGYPNRLKALLAVLRAKFYRESDMGVALMGTGSAFLLYYASDTEVPRNRRHDLRGPTSNEPKGVPVSESSFDEPGLNNTLGMLLMFIRHELGADDGGWGHWLEQSCSVSDILEDSKDSRVEFGKVAWNAAVLRCSRCVDLVLKRHKDMTKEKKLQRDEIHKTQLIVREASEQIQMHLTDQEGIAEKRAERECKHAADAGISVYTPQWDVNPQAQLHDARESAKPVADVAHERSRSNGAVKPPTTSLPSPFLLPEEQTIPTGPAPPLGTMEVHSSAAAEAFFGDALASDAEMSSIPATLGV